MKANYCTGSLITGDQLSNTSNSYNPTKVSLGTRHHYQQSHPTAPYIVFRSAKYDGPHARAIQMFRGYAKYYIVLPAVLIINRCKNAFYQLCGLLLLLMTSPLWILMFMGLFITRRLRLLLIRKLYPDVVELNGSYNNFSFSHESLGIVNSVIWTKGKFDVYEFQKRFKVLLRDNPNVHQLLKLRKTSKLGLCVWECCNDFELENHIVESPKQFRNYPIVDEPLKELYRTGSNNKSVLQKYVSYIASSPLDCARPPWKIHIVPYISREDGVRDKTCLVIRMHVALISNHEVQRTLRELFLTSTAADNNICKVHRDGNMSETAQSCNKCRKIMNDDKLQTLEMLCIGLWGKVKEIWKGNGKALKIWANLKLKQLEYHSRSAVLSLVVDDIKNAVIRFLWNLEIFLCEIWSTLGHYAFNFITKLQAVSAVPMIILASLVKRAQHKRIGFQWTTTDGKKLISWSDLIHGDLVDEICEKTRISSPENVILMACSYALADYYQQNNIQNPPKLGFTVGNTSSILTDLSSLKAVHIPCDVKSNPHLSYQHLRNLEERVQSYPEWKLLGLSYVLRHAQYFLPRCLASEVQKQIVLCYPFSFTHVNLKTESVASGQSMLPICQLYGELVEDFTCWSLPPLSDFGISITLVRYTGRTRLFVMSPFQSLDAVLTHRCNQYLIKLAEDVGVDRSKIPYSRRSSPSSTSCSTPTISYINPVDSPLGSKSNLKRAASMIVNNTR